VRHPQPFGPKSHPWITVPSSGAAVGVLAGVNRDPRRIACAPGAPNFGPSGPFLERRPPPAKHYPKTEPVSRSEARASLVICASLAARRT
jgi:hypothetical protein